jgi:hypothetical protein
MDVARAMIAAFAALAILAGCGGKDATTGGDGASDGLSPAPPSVERGCARAARTVGFGVLCPSRWPAGSGRVEHDFSRPPGAYLLDFANGFAVRGAKVFHLMLGGQRRPFGAFDEGLRVSTLQLVPMRGGGTFTAGLPPRRIDTAKVHGKPARIFQEPRYPQGGIHGGHILVAWNEHDHGYLVSLHASNMPRAEQVKLALAMARSSVATDAPAS